jgi:hypothetical protein
MLYSLLVAFSLRIAWDFRVSQKSAGMKKRSQSDRMNGVKKAIIQGATHPFAWHTLLSFALFFRSAVPQRLRLR